MATELKPGVFTAGFTRMAAEGDMRGRVALEPLARVIEGQAKINASAGSHPYGTKTPARPGTGPAVISGNLRRSITHSPIRQTAGGGWETRVGTGIGFFPPYGGKKRTPANTYAVYLEIKGVRGGAKYPFLRPAFTYGIGVPARVIFQRAYGDGWTRLF